MRLPSLSEETRVYTVIPKRKRTDGRMNGWRDGWPVGQVVGWRDIWMADEWRTHVLEPTHHVTAEMSPPGSYRRPSCRRVRRLPVVSEQKSIIHPLV